MARKAGQLISRGPHTWLVRVSLGRDPERWSLRLLQCAVRGSYVGTLLVFILAHAVETRLR